MVCPPPDSVALEKLFRYEVFKLLKAEGKINDAVIENMMAWRHSGFGVYCGHAIWPQNEEGLENLARYIIRASFSQKLSALSRIKTSSKKYCDILACGRPETMILPSGLSHIFLNSHTMTTTPRCARSRRLYELEAAL